MKEWCTQTILWEVVIGRWETGEEGGEGEFKVKNKEENQKMETNGRSDSKSKKKRV